MKALFLTLYPASAASPRYRVVQYLPYLEARGVACTVASPMDEAAWRRLTGPERRGRAAWYHVHETPRRLLQILSARRFDVVFLQKALLSAYLRGMPSLFRSMAGRYVYDIDDAVHLAPPHSLRGPWKRLEDPRQVDALMAGAWRVLAGNSWLAEEARARGAHAEVFPTVVDTDRFVPPAKPPEDFVVGWLGSPSTTPSLRVASEALADLSETRIRLVGADAKQVHWPGAEIGAWSLNREVREVQGFSVGIMPQLKDEWTRGKCALKALIYMACGVPCVATPYGAVREIIRDGENGLFADSPGAWRDAMVRLRDPAERARLGAAGRATVEARYALRVAAPRLHALIEEAAG